MFYKHFAPNGALLVLITTYSAEILALVAQTVRRGGVIAFRTDTFYGLGADPFNREAVQRIKDLKGREDRKPILIVISDRQQAVQFIPNASAAFKNLAERFWPGPLTLIGDAGANVSGEITAGSGTIGVRLPDDEKVCALVSACGGALTATSANPASLAPATSAQMVADYFGDQIDLIIDDGEAKTDHPSTVVDASGDEPKLIREGVIPWSLIHTAI